VLKEFEMDHKIVPLLIKARTFLAKYGVKDISLDKINEEGFSLKEMFREFKTVDGFVETILEYERQSFQSIFKKFPFDMYNAIDALILICKEINSDLFYINPYITKGLEEYFPDIYNKHTKMRNEFIVNKVEENIKIGIKQNIYKENIDPVSTAQLLENKFNELYDIESKNGENFSFPSIMEKVLELYIKTNANADGINYYKNRRQLYGVLGFGW
jgi:hypothetical protein